MIQTTKKFMVPSGYAVATAKLIDKLQDGKVGDLLTDKELAEVCGRQTNAGQNGYGNLMSAIRHVRRNHGVVWERIREANQIKCLEPVEIITSAKNTTKRIRRQSVAATQKLGTIDLAKVDDSQRLNVTTQLAVHATIAQFSTAKAHSALSAAAVKIDGRKLLETTIAQFGK